MLRKLVVLGLLFCGLPLVTSAEEAKDEGTKVVHSKISEGVESCGAACRVNFTKELGLSLDYLGSIGHRISQARKGPDPVDLALAAQALSVAETVSGKKASITAEQVQTEALELVKMRGFSSELSAVALVIPAAKQDLEKLAIIAKKREEETKQQTDSVETSKALFDTLTVANHAGECLRIYVSGRYVGEVHQGQTAYFNVHDHSPVTVLQALCEDGGHLVSQQLVFGHQHGWYWHIH